MSHPLRQMLIAAIALTAAVVAWFVVLRPQRHASQVYFYDLGAGELYAESLQTQAPVKRPNGAEGVRAVVMACRSCSDASDRRIAYLEKNTEEYNQALARGETPTPQQSQSRSLIRTVDDPAWFPTSAPQARKIVRDAEQRCGSAAPIDCRP